MFWLLPETIENALTLVLRLQVLQRILNARQFGLKLIANVTYGYTAAGFSGRMPCAELADSIVQVSHTARNLAHSMHTLHPHPHLLTIGCSYCRLVRSQKTCSCIVSSEPMAFKGIHLRTVALMSRISDVAVQLLLQRGSIGLRLTIFLHQGSSHSGHALPLFGLTQEVCLDDAA